jgi:hypothetical protein
MSQDMKFKIDAFIAGSFRDIADADYLAARICWRRELGHQFFWMALQAIEKYLKGILLFNRVSARGFNHDLTRLLAEVKKLPTIELEFRQDANEFLGILVEQGLNRYFESNFILRGKEILLLDECVWQLRIRCVALNKTIKEEGEVIWTSQEHLEKIKNYQRGKNPNHISIPYGLLEHFLVGKSDARKDLIWKNFYFGSRHKRHIKFKSGFRFQSPYLVMSPEIFPELDKLVQFPKQVREHFQFNGKKKLAALQPMIMRW